MTDWKQRARDVAGRCWIGDEASCGGACKSCRATKTLFDLLEAAHAEGVQEGMDAQAGDVFSAGVLNGIQTKRERKPVLDFSTDGPKRYAEEQERERCSCSAGAGMVTLDLSCPVHGDEG